MASDNEDTAEETNQEVGGSEDEGGYVFNFQMPKPKAKQDNKKKRKQSDSDSDYDPDEDDDNYYEDADFGRNFGLLIFLRIVGKLAIHLISLDCIRSCDYSAQV